MNTIKDIIAALGGFDEVAEATDNKPLGVRGWVARNSIPVKHWPDVIALAKSKGVDVSPSLLTKIIAGESEAA